MIPLNKKPFVYFNNKYISSNLVNNSSQTTINYNNNSDELKTIESNHISPKGKFKSFLTPRNNKNSKFYYSKSINDKQNTYLPKISKISENSKISKISKKYDTNTNRDKIVNHIKKNTNVLIKIINLDLKKKKLEKKLTSINLYSGDNKKLMRYKSSNCLNIKRNNGEKKDYINIQKISPKRECLSIRLTSKIIGDIFL